MSSDWASAGRPPLQAMNMNGCDRTKIVKTGVHNDILQHRNKETMEFIPDACHKAACGSCGTPAPAPAPQYRPPQQYAPPPCAPVCPPPCAPVCPPPCPPKCVDPCDPCAGSGWGGQLGALFVWWLIIFAITWFVLYLLRPSWVLKGNDGHHGHHDRDDNVEGHPRPQPTPSHQQPWVDNGKVLLWALVISFFIVLLIWLFKSACSW